MNLEENVQQYVGGQMEIQNEDEGSLFRGEVASIAVEENELRVTFSWLAKGEGFPPFPNRWVREEPRDYAAGLDTYDVAAISEGRVCLSSSLTGETCVLYPPGGSALDPSHVEGLDLE